MRSLPVIVSLLLVAASQLGTAERARACTPPPPFGPIGVIPGDGATGVPTNVKVRLRYNGMPYAPEATDVIVRPVGGQAVAATVTSRTGGNFRKSLLIVPEAPLAPNTPYEVAGRIKPSCQTDCISPTHVVYVTFTTGAGPDTTPPTFAGVIDLAVQPLYSCKDGQAPCCGEYTGHSFALAYGTATDDTGIAGYDVYKDSEFVESDEKAGFALCGGIYSGGPIFGFFGTRGAYTVHAVDWAGNVDTNSAYRALDYSCAGGPDAGVSTPDGAGGDGSGGNLTGDEDGEGCSVGGRPTGGALLLLGVALLAIRRRRG
jgi:MYXO-CTERM domain-containing protein